MWWREWAHMEGLGVPLVGLQEALGLGRPELRATPGHADAGFRPCACAPRAMPRMARLWVSLDGVASSFGLVATFDLL